MVNKEDFSDPSMSLAEDVVDAAAKAAGSYVIGQAKALALDTTAKAFNYSLDKACDYTGICLPTDGPYGRSKRTQSLQYNAKTKKSRIKLSVKPHVASRTSSLTTNAPFFDSEFLEAQGEGTMVPLVAKIGPAVKANHFKSFLEQFLGKGQVRTSFAGRVLTKQATRAFHTQVFRHKLSVSDDTSFQAYPNTITDRILSPASSVPFELAGPVPDWPPSSSLPPGTTSWRDMKDSTCYFASDNLTDFENLSWNLNRYYKSRPAVVDFGTPTSTVRDEEKDVPYLNHKHSRVSVIQEYNAQGFGVNEPSLNKFTPAAGQYHAVVNSGSIHYNFMNKGLGGCKVTVVVFKVKKTHTMSPLFSDYTTNVNFPMESSVLAIQNGWLRKCMANAAVQLQEGEIPNSLDVTSNPAFPFLPKLKQTLEADNDISEHSRQTFALPSGSRRDVTIMLPGMIWNPCSVPQKYDGSGNAILNEYTYLVTIASCGVSTTNVLKDSQYNPNPARGFNVGDDFCESNLQFTGTYTENVGGALFVPNNKNWLYNAGGLILQDLTGVDNVRADTRTMIRQKDTVRVPGYVAREEQTYVFPGAPPPGVATGATTITTVNPAHAATNDANDGSSSGVNAPF